MSSAVIVAETSIRGRRRDIFPSVENNTLELQRKPLRVELQERARKDRQRDRNHNLEPLLLEAAARVDQVLDGLPRRITIAQGPQVMEDLPRQGYRREMVGDRWPTVLESDTEVQIYLLQSSKLSGKPLI